MPSRIEVTPAQLRSKANQLRELNSRYKRKVGDLNEKEVRLNGQWDGEANDVFHRTFQQNKGYLDRFHEIVEKYIQALLTAAQTYEQAENKASGMATTR